MKRWGWMCSLLLLLLVAACSADETSENLPNKEQEETDVTEEQGQNEDDDTLALMQDSIRVASLSTLYDLVEQYGYIYDEFDFYEGEYEVGVIYARIVDFNNDGINELVTLHKGSSYLESIYDHRVTDDYVLEIWGTDYNTFDQIYVKTIPVDSCSACDLSLGVTTLKDGTSVYYETSAQTAQGTTFSNTTYFVMEKPGAFTRKHFLSSYAEDITYQIDGQSVNEETYLKAENAFIDGDTEQIIEGNMGTKSFAFPEKSSGKMVAAIIEQYDLNYDEIVAAGQQVDAYTIQAESEYVVDIDRIDVLNSELINRMITYVILYGGIEQDMPSSDVLMGISEEQVAEKYQQIFGVPLPIGNLDLKTPDIEDYEVITYEDGVFYLLPTDFYSNDTTRTVQRAVKLDDDTYYLEVHDLEFNVMGYYTGHDAQMEELEKLKATAYEEWPEDTHPFVKSNIPRFILLKMVDGVPTFRYIGYRPLMLEEVKAYK